MKSHRLLGIVSFSILLISASGSAFAANMTGNVISIDPIEARQNDGSVKTFKLEVQEFNCWDSRRSITLFDRTKSVCNCMDHYLGTLEKPISLHVESQGAKYTLTIPAHRTVLFNHGSIQIDIKDSGSIGVDQVGSSAQHDAIIADYENLRKSTTALLSKLTSDISANDLPQARNDYSEIVANELYSSDLSQLDRLIKSMPESERPINTYTGDFRWVMKSMVETFNGVNFDRMTLKEFVDFIDNWASTTAAQRTQGDQTYLFRFMIQVGIPQNIQEELLIKTLETRLKKFENLAKDGADPRKDVIWNDQYNLDVAFTVLKNIESETAQQYIQDLKSRVVNMDVPTQNFLKGIFLLGSLFR